MSIYKEILKQYWGYSDFRTLQEDIIISVADKNKDTLGLLPTGGGKSIIFQVPALAKNGICIVVSPLIALMKDQVENLAKRGIKAAAIYTGMSRHEIELNINNCVFGNYKFLYLSPERLTTDLFLSNLPKMKVNLIAIDESHCISQWGYDFRPSYLQIAKIREFLPQIPILALTATATPEVVIDIQDKLKFKEHNIFKKSFERKNLIYIVRYVEDKNNYLLKIVLSNNGSGVVYVKNRKQTKEVAMFLQKNKVSADYYHAGIEPKEKDLKQEAWKKGRTRIIVSTNAFGMGIDKADVRFVVHMDLPDSLEAYFQEAGRGGRDEKTAYAVLLYNDNDKAKLYENIENSYPSKEIIKNVYNAMANYFQLPVGTAKGQSFGFDIMEFAKKYSMSIVTVYNSLKFLQREGYIEYTEDIFNPSKMMFTVSRDQLYKFQVANEKFDTFLKLLLRIYGGLFSNYVNIDEKYIATKSNISEDLVKQYLTLLDKNNIISYAPQQNTPYIIYTEERLDERNLRISKENYDDLKNRYIQKIDVVLKYATGKHKCRSLALLEYFGETEAEKCGNCDVCRNRNENNITNVEFTKISEQIINTLIASPLILNELVLKLPFLENKILTVIQTLLENNKIKYNEKLELSAI